MLYLAGLRKPTGFFPAASRASLINDPTTGEETEVPATSQNDPSMPARCPKNGILYELAKEHTNDVVCTS